MKLFEDGIDYILVVEEFESLVRPNMSDALWEMFAGFLDIHPDVKFSVTYSDYFDWTVSRYIFPL